MNEIGSRQLEPEDAARAEIYSLLARLFYDGADAALMKKIAAAPPLGHPGTPFGDAWRALARSCSTAGEPEVRQEYEDLFIGPGQAEVTLYLNHYRPGAGRERVLAALRGDLARYGAQRHEHASEPEDHAAALFDLMRVAIAKEEEDLSLEAQEHLFSEYIQPSYLGLCDTIRKHPAARFYRHVAEFAAAFLDLERAAFALR